MEDVYDIVIIGAGIMGSATAYYASDAAAKGSAAGVDPSSSPSTAHTYAQKPRILVLEQFQLLHSKGSSHGESRIIRMTYEDEHYTSLMKQAYKLWAEAERDSGLRVFTQTGGIDMARHDNQSLKNVIEVARRQQIELQVLSAEEVLERFGGAVKLPSDFVCLYSPEAGILNATKACHMFQTLAKRNGCVFKESTRVVDISLRSSFSAVGSQSSIRMRPPAGHSPNGLLVLQTDSGERIYTKSCIVTAGAWTKKLLEKGGAKATAEHLPGEVALSLEPRSLPLKPVQTTVAYWRVADPFRYSSSQFPVFISYEDHIYGFPCHEYPDLLKCCYHGGPEVDPDKRDFRPGVKDLEASVQLFLARTFLGVEPHPVLTESCMYTWTPDADFIIDSLPLPDPSVSLVVGCGFSGHGFKLAPVVGKMLAEMAKDGRTADKEAACFKLNRPALGTGIESRLSKL